MNEFRIRLANAMTVQGVTCADADNVIERVMQLVKEAIETPLTSPEIDTWLVRTGLGKQGTRVVRAMIDADGAKSVEMADRNVEIFTRIYATERECGTFSDEAIARAHKVVESMTRIGVINGEE